MAPTLGKPFHRPGWMYEEKYDGWRMIAYKDGSTVRLISRNNVDHTERFRELAGAIAGLKAPTLILATSGPSPRRQIPQARRSAAHRSSPLQCGECQLKMLQAQVAEQGVALRRQLLLVRSIEVLDAAAVVAVQRSQYGVSVNGKRCWTAASSYEVALEVVWSL